MKKRQLNVRRLYSSRIGWSFLFFSLFFILFPVYATATIHEHPVLNIDLIITGVVTNSKTGEPLAGVSVIQKGTTNGTVTDDNGMYKIQTKENSTLIFSAVGYISQEIIINQRGIINVALQEGGSNLDEVVVIGYGKQKASNITGAIAKISAQDLDERPTSRIDHAMAGKLSGVQVQEISGTPGRAFSVKVRGTSSISNSSSPLYVIDGYPISSGLDNINPNDIESIEVLKDAASAAIYGSRGSSGVVLITTKTGKGGKPVLQFDTYYGIQERFSKVDVLKRDEYIAFAIEERNNTWKLQGGNPSDPNSVRSSSNYWIDPLWLTNPSSFPDNDWQDLISRKAPVQN